MIGHAQPVRRRRRASSSTTTARPTTVDNYARDVTAFLAWTADPRLEERKRIGMMVMIYLLITAVLLYFAKRRIWAKAH